MHFQELFAELKNLFSMWRYGSVKLVGFGNYREMYRETYREKAKNCTFLNTKVLTTFLIIELLGNWAILHNNCAMKANFKNPEVWVSSEF